MTNLRPQSFEWRKAEDFLGYLWIPLGFLLLVPVLGHTPLVPWKMADWPLLERAIPIAWLLVAGALALFGRVSRASIPLAALLTWCLTRTAINAFPVRGLQILLLMSMVALLYVAAREMDFPKVRLFAWVLALGVLVELALGYLNLFKIYPWMPWVVPDQVGRAMGMLTHPNYWGSIMAMALPVMWALLGPLAAVAVLFPILWSYSANPAISALAGILVVLWPELSRRVKYLAIAGGSAVAVAVMQAHEWRLNGRREIWAAIWPELIRYPIIGQGLGDWRIWADQYNAKLSAAAGQPVVFASLQAHNEPYQLLFELGLIGLILAVLWGLQAVIASKVVWKMQAASTAGWWKRPISMERAWLAVLVVAVVNSFASPTFHLPAQAALAVFALARVQAQACAWSTFEKLTGGDAKSARNGHKKHVPVRAKQQLQAAGRGPAGKGD